MDKIVLKGLSMVLPARVATHRQMMYIYAASTPKGGRQKTYKEIAEEIGVLPETVGHNFRIMGISLTDARREGSAYWNRWITKAPSELQKDKKVKEGTAFASLTLEDRKRIANAKALETAQQLSRAESMKRIKEWLAYGIDPEVVRTMIGSKSYLVDLCL